MGSATIDCQILRLQPKDIQISSKHCSFTQLYNKVDTRHVVDSYSDLVLDGTRLHKRFNTLESIKVVEYKNSQILKYNQLRIATLLGFGSCLLIISGSFFAPLAYSQSHPQGSDSLVSGEVSHANGIVKTDLSHAEAIIKADESHVTQSLIYLPQVIRTH